MPGDRDAAYKLAEELAKRATVEGYSGPARVSIHVGREPLDIDGRTGETVSATGDDLDEARMRLEERLVTWAKERA